MGEHKHKIWTLNEGNFMEAYEAEIGMIKGQMLTIDIDPITLLSLIGTLQLGLKHREHSGPTAQIVRDFLNLVSQTFFRKLPAITAVINKGFQGPEIKQKPELNSIELSILMQETDIENDDEFGQPFYRFWSERLFERLLEFQIPDKDVEYPKMRNDSTNSPAPEEISPTAAGE